MILGKESEDVLFAIYFLLLTRNVDRRNPTNSFEIIIVKRTEVELNG